MSKKKKKNPKRKWTVLGDWFPAADFLLKLGIIKESTQNPLHFVKGKQLKLWEK